MSNSFNMANPVSPYVSQEEIAVNVTNILKGNIYYFGTVTFTAAGQINPVIDNKTQETIILEDEDIVLEVVAVGTFTGAGNFSSGLSNDGTTLTTTLATDTTGVVVAVASDDVSTRANAGNGTIFMCQLTGATAGTVQCLLRIWRR
jgi:hypothetical protein